MIRHILQNSPETRRPRHEIEFDSASLMILVDLLAPTIILATEEFPDDGTAPQTGIGGILVQTYGEWVPKGWANTLQVNAAFLHTLASGHLNGREHLKMFCSAARRRMVSRALSCFQDWKNRFCTNQQQVRGTTDELFGVHSPFFAQDWTETIEALLEEEEE